MCLDYGIVAVVVAVVIVVAAATAATYEDNPSNTLLECLGR